MQCRALSCLEADALPDPVWMSVASLLTFLRAMILFCFALEVLPFMIALVHLRSCRVEDEHRADQPGCAAGSGEQRRPIIPQKKKASSVGHGRISLNGYDAGPYILCSDYVKGPFCEVPPFWEP